MPPVLLVAQFTLIFWAGHAREEERNNEHYALLITNWSSYYSKFLPAAGVHSIRQVVWSKVSTEVLKESLTTRYSVALIMTTCLTLSLFLTDTVPHYYKVKWWPLQIWKSLSKTKTWFISLLLQMFPLGGNEVFINSAP